VSEPESDHAAVHTVVKKIHGCGVAANMRGYSLPFERVTGLCSKTRVLGDETLDRITAKSASTDAGEEGISGQTATFTEPGVEHFYRFQTERGATLFSPLSEATHVSTGPQNDILAIQPNQLGNP
jgi:hypothetical protein